MPSLDFIATVLVMFQELWRNMEDTTPYPADNENVFMKLFYEFLCVHLNTYLSGLKIMQPSIWKICAVKVTQHKRLLSMIL